MFENGSIYDYATFRRVNVLNWVVIVVFALFTMIALSTRAHTQEDSYFKQAFGFDCPPHAKCVLPPSMGGKVYKFQEAAAEVVRDKSVIIINDKCYSACATFADWARKVVCISRSADFGVHQMFLPKDIYSSHGRGGSVFMGTSYVATGESQPMSPDIDKYAMANGGYPDRADELRKIPFVVAKRFWRVCSK